jgi:hypothetical protein
MRQSVLTSILLIAFLASCKKKDEAPATVTSSFSLPRLTVSGSGSGVFNFAIDNTELFQAFASNGIAHDKNSIRSIEIKSLIAVSNPGHDFSKISYVAVSVREKGTSMQNAAVMASTQHNATGVDTLSFSTTSVSLKNQLWREAVVTVEVTNSSYFDNYSFDITGAELEVTFYKK